MMAMGNLFATLVLVCSWQGVTQIQQHWVRGGTTPEGYFYHMYALRETQIEPGGVRSWSNGFCDFIA
jgi:hypothetical protein